MQKVRTVLSDDFVQHNAIFFVGSLSVAVLNYLYHPIVSRLLSVEAFGEVQGFLSLAMQVGVIGTVFGMVILNLKANQERPEESNEIVQELYSFAVWFSLGLGILLVIFTPLLSSVFSLPQYVGFFMVVLIVVIGTLRAMARSHVQAEKRFGFLSLNELLVSAGKILLALVAIWLGYAAMGALAGFVVSTLIGLIALYPDTKTTMSVRHIRWPRLTVTLRHELRFAGLVLAAVGFTTFLYTADILLIRYFFDSETSGLYAGIATVARTIVFATGSVAGVLLSHVALRHERSHNLSLLIKALVITALLSAAALLIFSLMPSLVVGILMGESYLVLAPLLPLLALAMSLVAMVNLLIMYLLALRDRSLIPIVCLGSVIIAFGAFLWHDTVQHIVWVFIVGLLVVGIALIYQVFLKDR